MGQKTQHAATANAAHCIGHRSALRFQARLFPVFGLMRLGFLSNPFCLLPWLAARFRLEACEGMACVSLLTLSA